MAKRAFNPEGLAALASDELRPPMGVGALVWRFTVFVPLEERRQDQPDSILLADFDDLENLRLFDQGLVLVERQEVLLLGKYRSAQLKRIENASHGQ